MPRPIGLPGVACRITLSGRKKIRQALEPGISFPSVIGVGVVQAHQSATKGIEFQDVFSRVAARGLSPRFYYYHPIHVDKASDVGFLKRPELNGLYGQLPDELSELIQRNKPLEGTHFGRPIMCSGVLQSLYSSGLGPFRMALAEFVKSLSPACAYQFRLRYPKP